MTNQPMLNLGNACPANVEYSQDRNAGKIGVEHVAFRHSLGGLVAAVHCESVADPGAEFVPRCWMECTALDLLAELRELARSLRGDSELFCNVFEHDAAPPHVDGTQCSNVGEGNHGSCGSLGIAIDFPSMILPLSS